MRNTERIESRGTNSNRSKSSSSFILMTRLGLASLPCVYDRVAEHKEVYNLGTIRGGYNREPFKRWAASPLFLPRKKGAKQKPLPMRTV